MIVWLEKALVLAIHDRQIAEHGGSAGVRDEGLLESALAVARLPVSADNAGESADIIAALLAAFGVQCAGKVGVVIRPDDDFTAIAIHAGIGF